jgi:hypothetical protein
MIRKLLTLLIITFLTISLSGYSQTYYVSNTGSDSYSKVQAQNIATPWKTIQHACNNATPGTTIQIMAGTYYEQDTVSVSGSAIGGYITLTNYKGGNVVLNGNGAAVQLLTISSKNYIKINGLEFYNCVGNNTSIGIFIDGVSNYITISNCTIHHIYWNTTFSAIPNTNDNVNPLIVYGDSNTPLRNLTIQGNHFYDNAPGFSEVCSVNGNVDGFSIIDNILDSNANIGIDMEGNEGVSPNPATDHARNGLVKGNTVYKCHSIYDSSAAGIYVDGGINITIEQNASYNNDWGIEVGCETPGDTTAGITVRDNMIYRNGMAGMQVGGYDGPVNTGRVINSTISNNTFFNNDTLAEGNGELSLSYSEHGSFYNNIFYSASNTITSAGWNGGNSLAFKFDYNTYYVIHGDSMNASFSYGTYSYTGFSSYKTGSGFDGHSIFKDPSLTDTSRSVLNFRLLPVSTCINGGMPGWPVDTSERDFYGETRIISGRIDIGADEYQSTTGLPVIGDMENIRLYPNPNNGQFTIEVKGVDEKAKIEIYNMLGEKMCTIQLNSSNKGTSVTLISLTKGEGLINVPTGVYFYRIMTESGNLISEGKFIIQK